MLKWFNDRIKFKMWPTLPRHLLENYICLALFLFIIVGLYCHQRSPLQIIGRTRAQWTHFWPLKMQRSCRRSTVLTQIQLATLRGSTFFVLSMHPTKWFDKSTSLHSYCSLFLRCHNSTSFGISRILVKDAHMVVMAILSSRVIKIWCYSIS